MATRHNKKAESKKDAVQETNPDSKTVSPEAATKQAEGKDETTVQSPADAKENKNPETVEDKAPTATDEPVQSVDASQLEVDYVEMGSLKQQVAELQESVTMYMELSGTQKAMTEKLQTDLKTANAENQRLNDALSGSTDATSSEIATLRAEYATLLKKSENIPNLEKSNSVLRAQVAQLKTMEQVVEHDDKPTTLRAFTNAAALTPMQEYHLPVNGTTDEYSFWIVSQGHGLYVKNITQGSEQYHVNLQPHMRENKKAGTRTLELMKITENRYS